MSNLTSVMPSNSSARTKRFIIKALEYFALLLATFIALLPLVSSFMISFKTAEEYGSTNAMTPPANWLNFGNYVQVWNDGDMPRAFLTSGGVVAEYADTTDKGLNSFITSKSLIRRENIRF